MKFFRPPLLILLFLFGICPLTAHADSLDVFDTGKNFPTDFLFNESIPSLKGLDPNEIEPVLQTFRDALLHVESPAQSNLIYLGISYIHLTKNEYKETYEILTQKISGDFILEDFRIHFLTVALRRLAEESFNEGNWDQAAGHLEEALRQQMILFENLPASPFHEDVPRYLAHIEARLGDAYFEMGDYPSAWKNYNKALVREYPIYERNPLKIHLALARTYEAGKNLNEAADIYIYLLNHFPSRHTRAKALAFLKNNLEALEQSNGNADQLKRLLKGQAEETAPPGKPVARKLPKWPQTNNVVIGKLYLALSRDDFPKILEHGERVLKEFPGDESVKGVLDHVNQAILTYLQKNQWNENMDRLVELYPVRYMSKLARRLWEGGFPDAAQLIYQKVLDKFPTETLACHKALFFMGRIEEDNHRYQEAIQYYEELLDKYNWGYFTPAAQFKIPWLNRLLGQLKVAREGFIKLLKFSNPQRFRNLDNGFPEPDDFRPATLYWLADTENQSGNYEAKAKNLNRLVKEFPMDFYALVARLEMSRPPLDFLEPQSQQKATSRKWGLGEINRKRINRAEKLIAIGFLEMGMKELSKVTQGEENQEFLYYLAQLFKRAGGFQKAIGLSWNISRHNHHDSLSPSLAAILFPKPYLDKAVQESSKYNLSPYLVMALMRQESAFNRKVVSSADAIGLMQLLPTTATKVARSMGAKLPDQKDLKKAEVNIQLGVKYLSELLNDFQDNIILALASYNAGPGKVKHWKEVRSHLKPMEFMESIPFKETRDYVKKVLRNYVIYKTLYGEGKFHDFQGILTVREN